MSQSSRAVVAASVLLAVAGCAGVGGQSQATLTPLGAGARQPAAAVAPVTQPRVAPESVGVALPSFDSGVKSKTEPIVDKGGKLTLPGLPSLKGSFGYPSNNAPSGAEVALSASLTNAFNAPTPSGVDVVYFLEATLDAKALFISFNSGSEKAKVSGSLLNPADSYTLYVYVPSLGNQPVATVSVGSPNAKHQLKFTSPFNGETLPANTAVILELGQS